MKKLKLNLENLDGTEVLSRAQLKNLLGGFSGEVVKKKCCPTNQCSSSSCSECVEVPPGHTATCTQPGSQICDC